MVRIKSIDTFEEERDSVIGNLKNHIDLETKTKNESTKDFFHDMVRSARIEVAKENPGRFRFAKEDVDNFLSDLMVLYMDNKSKGKLISKYLSDHLLKEQENPSNVDLYINYRTSGEWITIHYGFLGTPTNTRLRNGAKKNSMFKGKAKVMEDSDFIKNGKYFFNKAADIAESIPYRHPDNEVLRDLSQSLENVAIILQRCRSQYCKGFKMTNSDLDNLTGNY